MRSSGRPAARAIRSTLELDHLGAGHARAGEHDDEGHVLRLAGRERRHQPALAVAHQADLLLGDLRMGLEPLHPGQGVLCKIGRGGGIHAPRRAADPAVVRPQHGDAMAAQMVGEDQERLMTQERLIAVLGAAAGDQHHRRKGTLARRDRQRAGELHIPVRVGHLLRGVRERRPGLLDPLGPLHRLAAQPEGERGGALGEGALDRRFAQRALERGNARHALDLEADLLSLDGDLLERHALGVLHGDVDGARPGVAIAGEVDHHLELARAAGQLDLPLPVARRLDRLRRPDEAWRQQDQQEKDGQRPFRGEADRSHGASSSIRNNAGPALPMQAPPGPGLGPAPAV